MKSKSLISFILAAALAGGAVSAGTSVLAVADEPTSSEQQENIEDSSRKFSWIRNSERGIVVDLPMTSDEAVLLKNNRLLATLFSGSPYSSEDGSFYIDPSVLDSLDDGDNTLLVINREKSVTITISVSDGDTPEQSEEPTEEPSGFELTADNTDFTWDRTSGNDIVINTNSTSKEFAIRSGVMVGSSLISPSLSIEEGKITIAASFLSKLKDGQNSVSIILKDGRLPVNITVTDSTPHEEKKITAQQTEYVWERSELIGISVNTDSGSRSVSIMKDGEVLASDKDLGVYVTFGRVGITAKILKLLDLGENRLTLVFDDGSVDINVTVTDKRGEQKADVLEADETEFTWERNSDTGIVIQTNSASKNFSVKKGGLQFSSSLINKSLSIEDGQIFMEPGFLKTLKNGKNDLTIVLKEGKLDITVYVRDGSSEEPGEASEITAEETYFYWDRSNLIGIAVKTDSRSKNVVVTKNGEPLFSNEDIGVYVTFGRVGITAKYLRMLENGENDIVLEFDDGKVPITVNVTDKKNLSPSKDIVADQTVFTWKRGSGKSIVVTTNSVSEEVAVRRSGKLSIATEKDGISIKNGAVTMTAEYLETLSDGKNNLSLIFSDGKADITVNVTGTQSGQSSSIFPQSSSSSSYPSGNIGLSGSIPDTGSAIVMAEILLAASASAIVSILFYSKKKRKKSNELNNKE